MTTTGSAAAGTWWRARCCRPRLDLGNEELVRSHVHAIWLAETGQSMKASLPEVLDMAGDAPSLPFLPDVWRALIDGAAQRRATLRADRLVADLRRSWTATDDPVGWWHDGWVADTVGRAADNLDRALERWRDLYRTTKAEYLAQGKLAVAPGAARKAQQVAAIREREARDRLHLLSNENSEGSQTDFYSYRYLASEGFLPGYSFPRLPLAAYIPGSRGARGASRDHDGGYLQRPRFLAIREFGPGSLIYHEGARYEVVRVQLPRSSEITGGVDTEDARRCGACGYHHPVEVGTDTCEHCGARLGAKIYGLLRLQTVHTRRRERISSDEEERRRSGFEIETSYRFAAHGERAGRIAATASVAGAAVAEIVYGDAATIRLANVGRRRRKLADDRGFWLDPVEGRWLSDKAAADATVDADDLEATDDAAAKKKVIPYVEDTRNILLLRATDRLTRSPPPRCATPWSAASRPASSWRTPSSTRPPSPTPTSPTRRQRQPRSAPRHRAPRPARLKGQQLPAADWQTRCAPTSSSAATRCGGSQSESSATRCAGQRSTRSTRAAPSPAGSPSPTRTGSTPAGPCSSRHRRRQ